MKVKLVLLHYLIRSQINLTAAEDALEERKKNALFDFHLSDCSSRKVRSSSRQMNHFFSYGQISLHRKSTLYKLLPNYAAEIPPCPDVAR